MNAGSVLPLPGFATSMQSGGNSPKKIDVFFSVQFKGAVF
jgi:hypothetical protein